MDRFTAAVLSYQKSEHQKKNIYIYIYKIKKIESHLTPILKKVGL
jgi:hypothetical protein